MGVPELQRSDLHLGGALVASAEVQFNRRLAEARKALTDIGSLLTHEVGEPWL